MVKILLADKRVNPWAISENKLDRLETHGKSCIVDLIKQAKEDRASEQDE